MPPNFLRRFLKRAKAVFRPSPLPPFGPPPPQLTPYELEPLPQPLAPPQQLALTQTTPTTGQATSTATTLVANADHLTYAESSLAQAAMQAGVDAWNGLRTTLELLERSPNIFPTLKSAVAEFLGVIDIFETAARNRRDYAKLASNLQRMVDEFREHPGEQTSSKMSETLKSMASHLENEMKHTQEQRQRSGLGRHPEVRQDLADVRECYRRVGVLCRELQNKALIKIWGIAEEQQVDARLKGLNTAFKAMYNSSMSTVIGRRKCTPGTREAILAGMREWVDDPGSPEVYWLNGMAGTGKTTLAYSFCAEMQLAGRLGASFFCSRADADSQDVSRIIPTIAHQLARLLPSYHEVLVRQIGEDKDICARETGTQFEKLIRDPLLKVEASLPEGIVVVIDALDECDGRDGAQDILNILFLHARDLPLKFFVTCRPELGLFDALQSKYERYRSVLHLHDTEASFVQADIRTYLETELGETSLSPERLGQLAEQAGILFVYAATAVRYIRPKGRQVNAHQRLDDLLSIASKTKVSKHKGIDRLYTTVLAAPFASDELNPQKKENIRLVLDTAICSREPMSVATMAKLLELDYQDIIHALQHLRSVLHVSPGAGLISTLHSSFLDFMLDPERSKDLHCNVAMQNRHLALCCFSTMERLLRFNICNLESSFVLDKDIPDLAKRIDEAISPVLLYACRHWGYHQGFAVAQGDIQNALETFLSDRLLLWMEVLNLRKYTNEGAQILYQAYTWLQRSGGSSHLLELASDSARFVTAFGMSSASRSTPHIYVSALPFWPQTRPVRAQYWKHTRGLIRLEGPDMTQRDMSRLAVWIAAAEVLCVAFSYDGTRVVSGAQDGTICVWDAHNGFVLDKPFKGHTNWVKSVAFSPDGTQIVSGSFDHTIRVWDVRSGLIVTAPFEGHTGPVTSVAFSPDGTRIVSSSSDHTIRVWDLQSGLVVAGPFDKHIWVSSVAFSPDGTRVASGSGDSTICIWDVRSRLIVDKPFKGHSNPVTSVAFSPDGTRIASGSYDRTVRVWDVCSGLVVAGPFEGHTSMVSCVAFSPDGALIVSSSSDHTVRVWDLHSGVVVAGPFKGHTSTVTSVAFSPDGTRVVSGSLDSTICTWDVQNGLVVGGVLEGGPLKVASVAFSSDGTRIVSGSYDSTIRVWDKCSGLIMAAPLEEHNTVINCVAFSPDGTHIASASDGSTIFVWDVHRGLVVAGPFRGHRTTIRSMAFSPDSTLIASGSDDYTINVWDIRCGFLMAEPFMGHNGAVYCVAFSHDGTRIVSGSFDCTILVWDVRSGFVVAGPFEGHTGLIASVAFSPDGTHVVSGSEDCTIRVWDAFSGLVVGEPLEGHTDRVTSVAFSPDGTHVVSGSWDRTICIWDLQRGLVVAGPFDGHTDLVESVTFSPDGAFIFSGSFDCTIRVWRAPRSPTPNINILEDWLMDQEGMITTQSGQLIMCVPVDLHDRLLRPQNTAVICSKGSLKLRFDHLLLGRDWVECYQRQ